MACTVPPLVRNCPPIQVYSAGGVEYIAIQLCDNGNNTSVLAVFELCSGVITEAPTYYDLNGNEYTPVGEIGQCSGDSADYELLCDLGTNPITKIVAVWDASTNPPTLTYYIPAPDGTLTEYTPTGPVGNCSSTDVEQASNCYIATAAGTGVAEGDVLYQILFWDTSTTPPTLISTVWRNQTQNTTLTTNPTFANLKTCESCNQVADRCVKVRWDRSSYDNTNSFNGIVVPASHSLNATAQLTSLYVYGASGERVDLIRNYAPIDIPAATTWPGLNLNLANAINAAITRAQNTGALDQRQIAGQLETTWVNAVDAATSWNYLRGDHCAGPRFDTLTVLQTSGALAGVESTYYPALHPGDEMYFIIRDFVDCDGNTTRSVIIDQGTGTVIFDTVVDGPLTNWDYAGCSFSCCHELPQVEACAGDNATELRTCMIDPNNGNTELVLIQNIDFSCSPPVEVTPAIYVDAATGNAYTPADENALEPCPDASETDCTNESCYYATTAGAGYAVGDELHSTDCYDVSAGAIGSGDEVFKYTLWQNVTKGTILAAVPATANLSPCGNGIGSTDAIVLCDDNGEFIRFVSVTAAGERSYVDTLLDGETAYTPVGDIYDCAGGGYQIGLESACIFDTESGLLVDSVEIVKLISPLTGEVVSIRAYSLDTTTEYTFPLPENRELGPCMPYDICTPDSAQDINGHCVSPQTARLDIIEALDATVVDDVGADALCSGGIWGPDGDPQPAPFPINETFRNSTPDDPNTTQYGDAHLTSGNEDTDGNGWLRTNGDWSFSNGSFWFDTSFPSTDGINFEVDAASYGGTSPNTGDGFLFTLTDGAQPIQSGAIGGGGSLGIGNIENPYLTVAFDQYGGAGGPFSATIKLFGASNEFLARLDTPNGKFYYERKNAPRIRINIITEAGTTYISVSVDYKDGQGFQPYLERYEYNVAPPALYRFGFSGASGGALSAIHEFRDATALAAGLQRWRAFGIEADAVPDCATQLNVQVCIDSTITNSTQDGGNADPEVFLWLVNDATDTVIAKKQYSSIENNVGDTRQLCIDEIVEIADLPNLRIYVGAETRDQVGEYSHLFENLDVRVFAIGCPPKQYRTLSISARCPIPVTLVATSGSGSTIFESAPTLDFETICADGETAFRREVRSADGTVSVDYIGADGTLLAPTSWTPGPCTESSRVISELCYFASGAGAACDTAQMDRVLWTDAPSWQAGNPGETQFNAGLVTGDAITTENTQYKGVQTVTQIQNAANVPYAIYDSNGTAIYFEVTPGNSATLRHDFDKALCVHLSISIFADLPVVITSDQSVHAYHNITDPTIQGSAPTITDNDTTSVTISSADYSRVLVEMSAATWVALQVTNNSGAQAGQYEGLYIGLPVGSDSTTYLVTVYSDGTQTIINRNDPTDKPTAIDPEWTIVPCNEQSVDVEGHQFCDDNGAFMRWFIYNEEGSLLRAVDKTLAGDPYTPQGAVESCSSSGSDAEYVILCDDDGEFIRRYQYDSDGVLTDTSDYTLDGADYTVVGTVGRCKDCCDTIIGEGCWDDGVTSGEYVALRDSFGVVTLYNKTDGAIVDAANVVACGQLTSTIARTTGAGTDTIAAGAKSVTIVVVSGTPTVTIGGGTAVPLVSSSSFTWSAGDGETLSEQFVFTGIAGDDFYVTTVR